MKIPNFKNKSTCLMHDYVDYLIWGRGIEQHRIDSKKNGDERSYLRGIHKKETLQLINNFISLLFKRAVVSSTSIWVDKNPQAHFSLNGINENCELGDLLILFDITNVNEKSADRHRVGWILQGKTSIHNDCVNHKDKSTLNEIDLYEKISNFDVRHFKDKLGTYDLSIDQDFCISEKWSFLQFCLDEDSYINRRWDSSPIQRIWPLANPHWNQTNNHDSFFQALLIMAQTTATSPSQYGMILERNGEWRSLCETLMKFTLNRNSRLPRGAWNISELMSPETLAFNIDNDFHGHELIKKHVEKNQEYEKILGIEKNNDFEPPATLHNDIYNEDPVGISTLLISITKNDSSAD